MGVRIIYIPDGEVKGGKNAFKTALHEYLVKTMVNSCVYLQIFLTFVEFCQVEIANNNIKNLYKVQL